MEQTELLTRRTLLGALSLSLFGACRAKLPPPTSRRIVSLGPALTETLFAIGAGSELVGVSDYCDYPTEASKLPRTGTTLTPNRELLVSLNPSMIFGQEAKASRLPELSVLAPTHAFPWLSLPDVLASIEQMGDLVSRPAEARALARQIRDGMADRTGPTSPRTLVILGSYLAENAMTSIWYERRNSLHGAAIAAAGGRNAIDRDIEDAPRLSLEGLLTIDPEILIILLDAELSSEVIESQHLAPWKKITSLQAVRRERVYVVARKGVLSQGPRIVQVARDLEPLIKRGA